MDQFWQPVISFTIKLSILKGDMSAPLDMFAFIRVYKSVNSMKRKPKKHSLYKTLRFVTETHTFGYKVFRSKSEQQQGNSIICKAHFNTLPYRFTRKNMQLVSSSSSMKNNPKYSCNIISTAASSIPHDHTLKNTFFRVGPTFSLHIHKFSLFTGNLH